ncbi:MAG: carbohydrate kinase [Bacteroidetes bacterium]|nr:carbohydrate kinase [Bacteroidota bacterium]
MNNIDYTAVCFGEILWDVLPDKMLPGGAPMNVAYHLNQLGVPSAMISRVGQDKLGQQLFQFITSKNVTGNFIQIDGNHETSRVLAKLDGNSVTYDIVKPVAWDFIEYNRQLQQLISRTPYFIFGSLGARSEVSRQTLFELLEVAKHKVLDINLRKPHYDKSTLEHLLRHADVLKLNEDELYLLSGWFGFEGDEKDQIVAFQNKFHLNMILTTRGEKGAMVLYDGHLYEHPGYKVIVADTIGSGDSFLAAFLSKFIKGEPVNDALKFASGMGAFVATKHGACPVYTPEEVSRAIASFPENP